MHILLLNDTEDHDNWGSVAGAQGLKRILKRALPQAEFLSVPSAWTTRRFRITPAWLGSRVYSGKHRLLDRVSRPFVFEPSVADEFELVARDWLSGLPQRATAKLISLIHDADVVVYHAEGATYRVNRSAVRCLFAMWFAKTHMNTPCAFVNGSVTLGPVDPVLPAMVAKTFRAIDLVTVREPCSLRHVQGCAPDVDARLIPDSVFSFQQSEAHHWEEIDEEIREALTDTPFFCLSLSMLAGMQPGYMRHGAEGSSLVELIRRLKTYVPQSVILARDGMDQRIATSIAAVTNSVVVGPRHDFRDVMALLGKSRLLISGRYHHLILATIAGCPVVPLTTSSHKIHGLCELFTGLMGAPFDATDLWSEMDALTARASELLSDDRLPGRLRERAASLRTDTEGLAHLVAGLTSVERGA